MPARTDVRRADGERGAVSPFIVILLVALVGFAGLAYDAGQLFAARRDAVNIAASAARAGANDIDEPSIYDGNPVLAASATSTAEQFAIDHGVETARVNQVDTTRIRVSTTDTVELTFLGIFGLGAQQVTGEAEARLKDGVTAE